MHGLVHQVFHIAVLVVFFLSVGLVFLSLASPLLFPEREPGFGPQGRVALAGALAAFLAVAADWALHRA